MTRILKFPNVQKPENMPDTDPGFLAAVEEARRGFEEGGVPIGETSLCSNDL
jgi:hypothetical protein